MPVMPIFEVARAVGEDSDPPLVWEAIVNRAVGGRVSDIHVLAEKDGHELAFRTDGDMRYQGAFSGDLGRKIINHVKSVSGIDLAENRRPVEGRMKISVNSRMVDLRVSTIPTIHGQDMVVRIFDRTMDLLGLEELGILDEQLDYVLDMLSRPHGLILASGPTGSGKTTTLYAMLQRLSGEARKIITIEDPVEYDLPGINQTQVNPRIGVTFATMLTAILRQDPDVIMVGEIRDELTAVTAVRAANTGCLVLATTHAVCASRAIETMLSLGVHPYFLAVALRGVISQVLVKRICPDCKTPIPETADILLTEAVTKRLDEGVTPHLFQGAGCSRCYGTGYLGRMGLFELFAPNDEIQQLILRRASAVELEDASARAETLSLEHVGKLAALTGQTTMEELVAALPTD